MIERAAVLLVLAAAGAGWWFGGEAMSAMLERRVASGVPVTAVVTDANLAVRPGIYHSVDIAYAYAGRHYTGTLGWRDRAGGRLRTGEPVEVFVDPAAPRRVASADGGGSEGPLLVLPDVGLLFAVLAVLAAAQVRMDGLGRVSRRELGRSPTGGTVFRSTRFLTALPGAVVVLAVAVAAALAPHPVGLAVGLVGAGGGLWYLHTVVFGTRVVIRDGRLVIHNPRLHAVIPLAEVAAITHRPSGGVAANPTAVPVVAAASAVTAGPIAAAVGGVLDAAVAGTVVTTRDGIAIPVAATRHRDHADAERQARRIVALADAHTERATGPVFVRRNWRYLAVQAVTLTAVAAGLAVLLATAG
ncbi:DUF3592 domain-containing protein [Asanoa sp. WMMD1127]|uniref:DUF3592 domain-containing protein n=1 Tax=Asanoa sp. WMMD1127 TaxID=3016107 RepID=UPI002416A58B|nr:DUF3592 domain-containing protein [Asanoa sp. WMMD1127]MDG4826283.1 DUF3592 domain-containing protein [Asanoa sp. WMMD1127]